MSNIYAMVDTWNAGGTTFTAIKMDVTDTASATASLLLDLQVASTSVLSVRKSGALLANLNGTTAIPAISVGILTNGFIKDANGWLGIVQGAVENAAFSGTDMFFRNDGHIGFASGALPGGPDVGISRNAANVLEVNTGTTGTFASLVTKSVRGAAVTFANVPAAPVEGMMLAITDSSTAIWGATITGGGANHVSGYYNGTNWTVAGK